MFKIEIHHDRRVLADVVQKLVQTLPDQEQMVVRLFFGINESEHTVEEISNLMRLTTQRIYQIKGSAFKRLAKKQNLRAIQKQMVGYV